MPETPNNTSVSTEIIELSKTTSDHAKLLEQSARLDELEYHLLRIHILDTQTDLQVLHAEKSNTTP